jgi:hypothetical protein
MCTKCLLPDMQVLYTVPYAAGSNCSSPDLDSSSMAPSADKAAKPAALVHSRFLPTTGTQRQSQHPNDSLYSLQQDMTIFSKCSSMETSSQNENADIECQALSRSSEDFQHSINRAPLKESSDNFDHPPRLQKARSRTNAAIVEAAFESSGRLNIAGSLHSRTHSGKLSPRRRNASVSKRPATAETGAATRETTKWTPRSTITPSPAKAYAALRPGSKSSSAKKRNEWKVPSRSKSVFANARSLALGAHCSGEFSSNISASANKVW